MIIDTVTVTEIMIMRDSSRPGDRENKNINSSCIKTVLVYTQ